MKTKYAIIIPTHDNNIGYKLAALDTYLKHAPDNVDIYFVHGGNFNTVVESKKGDVSYTDLYFKVSEKISCVHKKLYKAFKKLFRKDYDYYIKLDDDTFLFNVDVFASHKTSGEYIGNRKIIENNNDSIAVKNKLVFLKNYKIREPYKGDLPKQYCTGECFILSKKAVESIINYKGPQKYEKFAIDDVAIGKILENEGYKININKFLNYEHPVKFDNFYIYYKKHYTNELIPA